MVVNAETSVEQDVGPRDVSRVRAADWPSRPLVGQVEGRHKRFQVIVCQSVLDDIRLHGQSRTDIEVCGVLVGNVYNDGDAPYCYVDANIRGNHSAGRSTQVTFTSETWTHINEIRDRDHPDQRIIGWYHTHPGFGIFLSEMDLFIHENFFPEAWQLAFVYDPKSGEDGMFVWREGKAVPDNFLVEHDTAAPPEAAVPPPASSPSGMVAELSSRLQAAEQRVRWLLAAVALCGLVAVVWPLVVFLVLPGIIATPPSSEGGGQPSGAAVTPARPHERPLVPPPAPSGRGAVPSNGRIP